MTEPTAPDRRANDQWIRDAHREHKEELATLSKKLDEFMVNVLNSIPDKDPKKHLLSHKHLEADMTERRTKEENDAKLKLEIRNGAIKTALAFLLGTFVLGLEIRFGVLLDRLRPPTPAVAASVVVTPAQKGTP